MNVFGGGLALYNEGKTVVGGLGASGDTSCADHNIAWRVRHNLKLDFLSGVGGVSGDPARPDNVVFDITPNPDGGTGVSAGGFGHPTCLNTAGSDTLPRSSRRPFTGRSARGRPALACGAERRCASECRQ